MVDKSLNREGRSGVEAPLPLLPDALFLALAHSAGHPRPEAIETLQRAQSQASAQGEHRTLFLLAKEAAVLTAEQAAWFQAVHARSIMPTPHSDASSGAPERPPTTTQTPAASATRTSSRRVLAQASRSSSSRIRALVPVPSPSPSAAEDANLIGPKVGRRVLACATVLTGIVLASALHVAVGDSAPPMPSPPPSAAIGPDSTRASWNRASDIVANNRTKREDYLRQAGRVEAEVATLVEKGGGPEALARIDGILSAWRGEQDSENAVGRLTALRERIVETERAREAAVAAVARERARYHHPKQDPPAASTEAEHEGSVSPPTPAPAPVEPAPEPAPADAQPAAPDPPAAPVQADTPGTPEHHLLLSGCEPYDTGDEAALAAVVADLERLGPDLPETRTVRGWLGVMRRRYAAALVDLRAAGDAGGERSFSAMASAAFLTKDYATARDAALRLEAINAAQGAAWLKVIDGPFREDYPSAADALEAMSPEGRYRIVTDIGLTMADLVALEERLVGSDSAAEEERILARAIRAHRGLKEVAEAMDKAIKAYMKLFDEPPPEVYPTVYVFSKQADFDRFSKAISGQAHENALGYYMPTYRVLVFFDQADGARSRRGRVLSQATLEVLLHETFHQWLHLYVENAPPWFNEGLAEYFAMGGSIEAGGLRYGKVPDVHPSRLDNIRWALWNSEIKGGGGEMKWNSGEGEVVVPPPLLLENLLRADHETFMTSRNLQVAVNYAHAWSFVHYLDSAPGGRAMLRTYFHTLRSDGQESAFRRVFAYRVDAMVREWRDYVKRMR